MVRSPKVLFVATVEIHILTFHLPYLQYFYAQGYEVHVACAGSSDIPYCHVRHNIPFQRSPFKRDNVKAYFALKVLMAKEIFAFVHCHTPVGGVIGRLAAMDARKTHGTKVLYTAHGFQFFKGGPVKDWIIYYPVEKMMARFTDVLITVNQEDYNTALRKKFKAGAVEKINGIGLDTEKFQPDGSKQPIESLKKTLGINENDFVLLCVGELNENKNQILLLKAVKGLLADPAFRIQVKLVLAGPDSQAGFLKKEAELLGIAKQVIILGYRNDVPELLAAADIVVSASYREGLPFNVLEAMAAGKPVIATDVRGHRDLIQNGVNGFLVKQGDRAAFGIAVKQLCEDEALRYAFGRAGIEKSRVFTLEVVMSQMREVYHAVLRTSCKRPTDC